MRSSASSIRRVRSPNIFLVRDRLAGVGKAIEEATGSGGRLDYDKEIEGVRALDRYTLQLKLAEPDYSFLPRLTATQTAAVAREVIEAYGDASGWAMANPVGTGAFKLKEWRRAQRIVLEANPNYREETLPRAAGERRCRGARRVRGDEGQAPAAGRAGWRSRSSRSRIRACSRSTATSSTWSTCRATS